MSKDTTSLANVTKLNLCLLQMLGKKNGITGPNMIRNTKIKDQRQEFMNAGVKKKSI